MPRNANSLGKLGLKNHMHAWLFPQNYDYPNFTFSFENNLKQDKRGHTFEVYFPEML